MDTGVTQSIHFGLGAAGGAGDDGAGVAHALAGRGSEARDEADHRLGHGLDVLGGNLFVGAADFAAHDDGFCLRIGLKERQNINEARAGHGVAADPDAGSLAEARACQGVDRLVGERAGAGHNADGAGHEHGRRDDADLRAPDGQNAGAVRAEQAGLGILDDIDGFDLVFNRDALGDADDKVNAGIHRFHDAVRRAPRRDKDAGGVRARGVFGFLHGVEDGNALNGHPAFAGGDAADDLGAVGDHLRGVELALAPGNALHNDFGVLVNKNSHKLPLPCPSPIEA